MNIFYSLKICLHETTDVLEVLIAYKLLVQESNLLSAFCIGVIQSIFKFTPQSYKVGIIIPILQVSLLSLKAAKTVSGGVESS